MIWEERLVDGAELEKGSQFSETETAVGEKNDAAKRGQEFVARPTTALMIVVIKLIGKSG